MGSVQTLLAALGISLSLIHSIFMPIHHTFIETLGLTIFQGFLQDPTTCRIWFGIATAYDFESHGDITEERLCQNIFVSHFG